MDDKVSQDNKAVPDDAPIPPPVMPSSPQATPPKPRKHTPLFMKIVFIIFGIVCFFGVVKVTLQNIFPPTTTTQTKTVKAVNKNVTWKTFTNKKFNYSVSFPDYLTKTDTKYSVIFDAEKNQDSGPPGFPALYVSVIPDGFSSSKEVYNFMSGDIVNKIYALKDNESVQTETGPDAEYWTFKRLASFEISSSSAVIIENTNVYQGEGTVNRRVLIKKDGFTYIIGGYFRSQPELDDLYKFLVGFRFLK